MYYYTPLPLNLANEQATSKQQASNKQQATRTSPVRFGHYSASSLRALLYCSHPKLVTLQNPSFEPKNDRWRHGAGAASREVPSQNGAFCAPKQPFLAPSGPGTQSKRPNQGQRFVPFTCALIALWQGALCRPLTPRYVRETAQKWLKMTWMCAVCVKQAQNQQQAVSWATWLKTEFREHLVPATPHFL